MSIRSRRLSRTLIAVTAAAGTVLTLAPAAQAAPSPQLPRSPLGLKPVPNSPLPSLPAPAMPQVLPAAPLPTVESSTVTRWVSVSVANVRSGPSTSYQVVATKTSGTKVSGVVSSNGWLKMASGQYMAPSVLTSTNPGTSTSPSTTVTQYVTATLGNVRSGPGLNYGVVDTLTLGTKVQGSWTNGWLDMGNGRFMGGSILSPDNPTGSTSGDQSATTVTRWVSAPIANVRSGPSTSYSIVGTKTAGTKVTGTVTSNGWLKMAGGQYMGGSVLTTTDPGAASNPGGATTVTQYVTATIGNVRSGPSTSYGVVGTLTLGTQVQGTWTNGWLDMGNGRFMGGSILSSDNPTGSTGGDQSATTVTQWVSAPLANVRSGPSTSYSVVGTKTGGTKVTGTVTSTGWLQLSSKEFMSPGVLTTTAPAPAPAPEEATPLRAALLATAAQYVGFPYVLYGTPPNAFDCSSYTWWVFKQHGITIPRTVRDQKTFVTPVTDPQPGDLIFYDDFYHVGIYAGPGMTYEALNPGAGVRYGQPVSTNVWYGRVPGL
ncbi:MAG: NlpC/P60 family protein [Ornithinimicrobium sp.]|uniref:C40 family peptidase n=1 Tax=Ornithinimicrobium sp. TaxID=1977084 RepID=UPI0026DF5C5F|nr:NlpC/P60 family protein [Ornithinimicrobium sp.]MDO5739699.1 NlpC/P60 family protein [Ornithinimicrobium sp.]